MASFSGSRVNSASTTLSPSFPCCLPPIQIFPVTNTVFGRPKQYEWHLRCTMSSKDAQPSWGRRQLSSSIGLFLFCELHTLDLDAAAAELPKVLDKYVKRKRLDPLETYVPAILLSQAQFKDIEKNLQSVKPKYDDNRSLLRSGPAASLRINIRAVAQYASEAGNGKVAYDAIDHCLSALEDLDSLLLRASRSDPKVSIENMKKNVNTAVAAIERLLQTVPSTILEKGKAIAEAYKESRNPALPEDGETENSGSDPKLLEGIL